MDQVNWDELKRAIDLAYRLSVEKPPEFEVKMLSQGTVDIGNEIYPYPQKT